MPLNQPWLNRSSTVHPGLTNLEEYALKGRSYGLEPLMIAEVLEVTETQVRLALGSAISALHRLVKERSTGRGQETLE